MAAGGDVDLCEGSEYCTPKPHGRFSWIINLGDGTEYIDLSVMLPTPHGFC